MSGVNKAILVGFLGQDPEVKFTKAGKAVCNFSMATNETWKDDKGEKQQKVEWHKIVSFDKLAEICGEHLKKGRQAYVEGKIQTTKWSDADGVDRWSTQIVAREVTFLGGKGEGSSDRPPDPPAPTDDDLPV